MGSFYANIRFPFTELPCFSLPSYSIPRVQCRTPWERTSPFLESLFFIRRPFYPLNFSPKSTPTSLSPPPSATPSSDFFPPFLFPFFLLQGARSSRCYCTSLRDWGCDRSDGCSPLWSGRLGCFGARSRILGIPLSICHFL